MCLFGGSSAPQAPVNTPSEPPQDSWKLVETRVSKEMPTMGDDTKQSQARSPGPAASRAVANPRGGAGLSYGNM